MSKIRDIIFGTASQIASIFGGTEVSGHSYSDRDLYLEEMMDEIELGADGSGTHINDDNQLIAEIPTITHL